ncbi:hypothetical protein ACFP1I_04005 [Dyadobacter subterraneus]|uniref:Uncharacterized protein n=1 Tax=Dyadobacter subterraneus TaxID=2773304 RepID=A0ABR9WK30_9BACT|nr:hypothetical protein [Dyadobacter subterraneus]MBE9464706.1 hypothetical protein [Dyadobacter subterraneus]
MKRISDIVLTWDTILGLIAMFAAICYVPDNISSAIYISIYGTAISVLSILFSIFFASLAVIISFPDNSFVAFLEKAGKYFSQLIAYYKLTLFILFVALFYTLVIYIYASLSPSEFRFSKTTFVIFIFMFTYSLVATISAVIVILSLTKSRAAYLANQEEESEKEEEGN